MYYELQRRVVFFVAIIHDTKTQHIETCLFVYTVIQIYTAYKHLYIIHIYTCTALKVKSFFDKVREGFNGTRACAQKPYTFSIRTLLPNPINRIIQIVGFKGALVLKDSSVFYT